MEDFNRIFELEHNFILKNDIVLSFYEKYLANIKNDKTEKSVKNSFNHYVSFTDNIQNRLYDSTDICDTMSLLIERDQFIDSVMMTNGLNK